MNYFIVIIIFCMISHYVEFSLHRDAKKRLFFSKFFIRKFFIFLTKHTKTGCFTNSI